MIGSENNLPSEWVIIDGKKVSADEVSVQDLELAYLFFGETIEVEKDPENPTKKIFKTIKPVIK